MAETNKGIYYPTFAEIGEETYDGPVRMKMMAESIDPLLLSNEDKTKLDNIESGAEVNVIETVKVNGTAQTPSNKAVDVPVPTKTSDLNNDSGFIDKDVNNLTNYYDKNAVDTKISAVYKYKGTVSTYNDLPSTNLTIGDVYNIETADSTHGVKAGDNVAWNGTVWDVLAGTVDLSGYQTKIDSSHKLESDLVDDTNQTNKFVTTSEKTTWNAKYVKPSGGIPKTDLSSAVQTSLEKADSALQEHQDISGLVKEVDYNKNHLSLSKSSNLLYGYDTFVFPELEVGNITNGNNANSNASRIRTKGYLEGTGKALITCVNSNYLFSVTRYYKSDGTYYNMPVTNSSSSYVMDLDLYKYRFVFRHSNGTTQITDYYDLYNSFDICINTLNKKNIFNSYSINDNVQFIAHKGYYPSYPENTIVGYKKAIAEGFINLECDIHWTSDNIPVLLHDDTIDRTSNGTGNIADMTFAEARIYDFGSWVGSQFAGEKIPSLEEFLYLCKINNSIPYIEIKTYGDEFSLERANIIYNLLKKYGMTKKSVIFGTIESMRYFLSIDGKLKVGVPMESTSNIDSAYTLQTTYPNADVFLQGNYSSFTSTIIDYAVEKGFEIDAWTLSSEALAKTTLENYPNISMITVNSIKVDLNS